MSDADIDGVLALNQHWVPRVGSLGRSAMESLCSEADLRLVATLTTPTSLAATETAETDGSPTMADRPRGALTGSDDPLPPLDALAGFVIAMAAGAGYGSPNYRFFAGRHHRFTYVDRVAVAPGARGVGVGRALYDAVIDHARRSGSPVMCAEVNLEPPNPGSQGFHAAYGFVEVARQWTCGDTVEVQLLELAL